MRGRKWGARGDQREEREGERRQAGREAEGSEGGERGPVGPQQPEASSFKPRLWTCSRCAPNSRTGGKGGSEGGGGGAAGKGTHVQAEVVDVQQLRPQQQGIGEGDLGVRPPPGQQYRLARLDLHNISDLYQSGHAWLYMRSLNSSLGLYLSLC